ncbi:MAG: NDP-sugar synthase [Vicinamibacterales bacterium]
MNGRCVAPPFAGVAGTSWMSPNARIEEGAVIEGPCFIDEGVVVKAGARIGPHSVIGRQCHVEEHATIERSIVWSSSRVSQEAVVRNSIVGRHCHIGRSASLDNGVVLGDKSVLTDFSKLAIRIHGALHVHRDQS